MVLKFDDFVSFVANWNNKPENIAAIRQELNIGFDSMLFLDDSPFERASVRTMLPEVIVPELPEDPDEWVKSLSELNLFEVASSPRKTHRGRTRICRKRDAVPLRRPPLTSRRFLKRSIWPSKWGACVKIPEPDCPALQRSNQFNLTTRRHNEAECEAMMQDDGCIPLYAWCQTGSEIMA